MSLVTRFVEALKGRGPPQKEEERGSLATPTRAPHSFTVGLDFGTAFSKCILRDTRLSPSRAFVLRFKHGGENPFLVPSEIYCDGDQVYTPLSANPDITLKRITFLKMALYATIRGHRNDPWLLGIAQHWPDDDETALHEKIETLVVVYLSALLRGCFDQVVALRSDFGQHSGDSWSVNMAVPVAHAQDRAVEEAFLFCLNRAWHLAQLPDKGKMSITDYTDAIREIKLNETDQHLCSIYPEVSANVQAFIKSPAGFRGLFLFVDVGAGTVDASTFIYWPDPANPKPLSYYSAEVIALGSSQVELRAAAKAGQDLQEQFRKCKEGLSHQTEMVIPLQPELRRISELLGEELVSKIARAVGIARSKLVVDQQRTGRPRQWQELKILMGGGGARDKLYTEAAQGAFRTWSMTPDLSPLPIPSDVEWPNINGTAAESFRRFSVAYGLSFDRATLEENRYPEEVQPVQEGTREELRRYEAPSKDEV